jgi:hypothetical protein
VYLPILWLLEAGSSAGTAADWYLKLGAKYDPELTETRLLDAAGLVEENRGIIFPDLLHHDARYRSDRYRTAR